jgi:two-component system LytT family sensor kinase
MEKRKKEWVTIALHVLLWLMVFLIPYIFTDDVKRGTHHAGSDDSDFLYLNTALNFYWVALFYLNAFLLLPRLVYQRRIALYGVILLGLFGGVVLVDKMLFGVFSIPRDFSLYHSVEHNFIPFIFTLTVSAAYKSLNDKTRADMALKEKQSEHLKTELAFLRSQVSPHFLFNVLNNIAALARLKSEDLEPTIQKLSSLMRYMLYENDEDKVLVKHEVEYLQDYIDLQKQRFGEELKLQVEMDIGEDWATMEPMLLIGFVENAFKHGTGWTQDPEIRIHLMVDKGTLSFSVVNKFEATPGDKDKTSGIGLTNVKRRLELLYPGRHQLSIQSSGGWFEISLQLKLPA